MSDLKGTEAVELALKLLPILHEESGHDIKLAAQGAGLVAMHLLALGSFGDESRKVFFEALHAYLKDMDRLLVQLKDSDQMGTPTSDAIH